MPDYSANGLAMRWLDPGPSRPGAMQRVLIDAFPAQPGNVMRLIYSVNGGPEQVARAWPTGSGDSEGWQNFAADLPAVRPGSSVDWRPILSNGLREADPKTTEPPAPEPSDRTIERFPYNLEFLARVTAPLDSNPYTIGQTPDGLRIVFPLGEGGTVRGPHFNGSIDHMGGDWMRIRDDGIGVTDIHALIQTDDGCTILSEYSGFVDFGTDGQQRMMDGNPPAQANLDLTPRYLTSEPNWKWINRLQCVGFGRVTMADLLVEYDLYAMRSRAVEAQEWRQSNA